MTAQWNPLRWPSGWKDPSALGLLKGTAFDYLVIDKGPEFDAVRARAQQEGIKVAEAGSAPGGVTLVQGEWPGVKMQSGGGQAAGGPTGVPWVDSNGWKIRLSAALHPETQVWVEAAPPEKGPRLTGDSYLVPIADSAAYAGRWIVTLDAALAAGLAQQKPDSLAAWKRIAGSAAFFAARKAWAEYVPEATMGVVSDFTGDNEFLGQELLNLLARAGGHYRILRKDKLGGGAPFAGLRAVLYADSAPPDAALRRQILAFVEAGGLLITVPKWGAVTGPPARDAEHPRYTLHAAGKGRIAQANADPDDPYVMANDAVLLVSHRYDLVRFWNGGATGSYYTVSPDRKKAVVHLLFYANRGPDSASVRIAGRYRTARAATVDVAQVPRVEVKAEKEAVELHLPQVSQYVAAELDV